MDYHAQMIARIEEQFYTSCTRYSTGAFLRMKLGKALEKRKVAPHLLNPTNKPEKHWQNTLKNSVNP